MGLRFNKRIKICKGVSVNLGKKGASLSVGTKGYRKTFSKNGTRTTVGIPGSGISYTDYQKREQPKTKEKKLDVNLQMPNGLVKPNFKVKKGFLIAAVVCLALSILNVLFLLPAFVCPLVFLIKLMLNKEYRIALYTDGMLLGLNQGEFNKAKRYGNKILKLEKNKDSDNVKNVELIFGEIDRYLV